MEPATLDAATAAAFVRRLGEHLDFNINIMDRAGVIIASRDPARVGSYHAAAHRLVESGRDIEAIHSGMALPEGVKPGVNLPVVYRGEIIGVVGVTGEPSEVGPVAYAVKTSVETMVELELYKERMLRRQDKKNLLLNYLLYDDEGQRSVGEGLAEKLGYDASVPRAPIIFRSVDGAEGGEIVKAIKGCPAHGKEDISATTPDGAVLVFKALRLGKGAIIASYEEQVEAYAEAAREALEGPRPRLLAWAGAFQIDFSRYRGAYRQVLWLADRFPAPQEGVLFLYRRLPEYLASRVPRSDLVDALSALASLLPGDFAEEIGSSVEALFESAFNGKEAAARLGVHRNTITARLERLKAVLGLDPRRDSRARELLSLLVRYLDMGKGGRGGGR